MHDTRWWGFVALALLLPGGAEAEEIAREFSHRFEAEGAEELRVRHGDGDVDIIPWNESDVAVEVVYRVEVKRMGWGTPPDLDVEFSEEDGVLSVVGREKGSVNVGVLIESHREYRYTIHAPPGLALDTRGEDGEVHISGWRAPLRCELEDGKVSVEKADLSFARFEMEDGDLTLRGRFAELEAGIEDGSLLLDGVQVGTAVLRAEDGSILANLLPGSLLDLEVEIEDGRVELFLPPDLSAVYSIRGEGGVIELEIPGGENATREKHGVTGQLGDGSGSIRITTEDGHVSLSTVAGQ